MWPEGGGWEELATTKYWGAVERNWWGEAAGERGERVHAAPTVKVCGGWQTKKER